MLTFSVLKSLLFNMDLLFSYGVLYVFNHRINVLTSMLFKLHATSN